MHVVVIGAGIMGICAALELQRDGHAVTIVEPGGAPSLAALWVLDNGPHLRIQVQGDPSTRYVISRSTDLLSWDSGKAVTTEFAGARKLKSSNGNTTRSRKNSSGPMQRTITMRSLLLR